MERRYFHLSSSLNRASIERYGLDWRRMGAAHGIAGVPGVSVTPEVEGIFILETEDEIEWFAHIGLEAGHESLDVWEVSLPADAEFLESQEGYSYVTRPIPPDSVRLHTADWIARDPNRVAGDFFHQIYYGDGTLDPDLMSSEAVLTTGDGRRRVGVAAIQEWAHKRALGAARTTKRSDGTLVAQIGGDGGFAIEGQGEGRCLVSPPNDRGFWTLVRVAENEIVELAEFSTRKEAFANLGN